MKITIVGPAYPFRGGIAHHVYWLHQSLAARGHEVRVISFSKLYPKLLFPGKTTLDQSNLKFDAEADPVVDPINPLTWLRAARIIAIHASDLVLFQWWNPFFGPFIGTLGRILRSRGLNVTIECHNVFPHEPSPVDLLLLDYAFQASNNFIAHSKTDKEALLSYWPEKRVIAADLPGLTALTADRAGGPRTGRTILFFGIVRPYKGLEVLIRALPKVITEIDCQLIVAGEFYEPEVKYQHLIAELGLQDRVRLINEYIPNERVAQLFDQADVLVLPYLAATQSAVASLAIGSGLPIIASRCGGLQEVVEHGTTGMLVTPGNHEELGKALTQYFQEGMGARFAAALSNRRDSPGMTLIHTIEEMAHHARG